MPKIDLTITITAILAICAIVSPIFTNILNNRHQLKIKELELKQRNYENTIIYRRKIFENYLKYAGRCIAYSDQSALKDYGEYYLLALLYAPDDLRQEMTIVHNLMSEYHWKQATPLFENITSQIDTILKTT